MCSFLLCSSTSDFRDHSRPLALDRYIFISPASFSSARDVAMIQLVRTETRIRSFIGKVAVSVWRRRWWWNGNGSWEQRNLYENLVAERSNCNRIGPFMLCHASQLVLLGRSIVFHIVKDGSVADWAVQSTLACFPIRISVWHIDIRSSWQHFTLLQHRLGACTL